MIGGALTPGGPVIGFSIGTAALNLGRALGLAGAGARLRRALASFGCGLLTVAALPPLDFLPALLGLAGLVALMARAESRREAALLGFAFGLGWFGAGLYWVGIAFYADAERFGALAVPGVLALTAICACFTAAAAWAPGSPVRIALTMRIRPAASSIAPRLSWSTHWRSSTNRTSGPTTRSTWAATFAGS